ncbi:MAG: hypothetical protein ACHREM_14265 [Polyangiales bacterium]
MDRLRRVAAAGSMAIVLATIASLASTACGPTCSGAERVYAGGDQTTTQSEKIWESSPPAGPYLPYEGGALYHFQHHLGAMPTNVQIWLSFSETPENQGGGGTPAAGNQALVLGQNADEVQIRNDTCSSFWIRVVVTAP